MAVDKNNHAGKAGSNGNTNNAAGNTNNNSNIGANLGASLGALAGAAAESAMGATSTEYEVQKGDTLSAIGKRFGVSWKEIYEANTDLIKDPDMIHVGWKLKIPNKG